MYKHKLKPMLITSYVNPDVDGVACAIAYAELLNSQGQSAEAKFFGEPQHEVTFSAKKANMNLALITDASMYTQVIIVDTSRPHDLDPGIDLKSIIEVIDHRKVAETEGFLNAKIQIELVASCATLIAERLKNAGYSPSHGSALLLYTAIISNSINFKLSLTTDRDRAMATWLENIAKPATNYIHDFYVAKSVFTEPIFDYLDADFTDYTFGDKKTGIAQLEIVDLKKFFDQHAEEILDVLSKLKKQYGLDIILFNGADIETGVSFIICNDPEAQKIVSKALNVVFENNIAYPSRLIMRKQISAKLKEELEK